MGAPIAQRLRDPRLDELVIPAAATPRPGRRWTPPTGGRPARTGGGEFVFSWRGRWRVATGDVADPLEVPFAGIVREVRPGTAIVVRAAGRGLRGIVALGGPTRGRLQVGPDGELRAGALDVGAAGTILIVGSRVDAETLTRARAMGVRGVIVLGAVEQGTAGLPGLREPPAIGAPSASAIRGPGHGGRRPAPAGGAVLTVLTALAGQEVAIVADPPMLVFDAPNLHIPTPPADLVRIRAGDLGGREGRFVEAIGPRRFAGGVHLEAGLVRFPDGAIAAVPLGDLERFV